MNKKQINFLVLLIMSILCFSCNDETILNEESIKSSLQLSNGELKFSSIEAYESLVDQDMLSTNELIKVLGTAYTTSFTSLQVKQEQDTFNKKEKSNSVLNLDEVSPVLNILNILNEKGIVVIGKWTLSIDLIHGIIGVTESKDSGVKQALVNKDFNNSKIRWFGTEDEVLSLLEEDKESTLTIKDLSERMVLSKKNRDKAILYRMNECQVDQDLDGTTNFLKDKKVIISEANCGEGENCKRWLADAKHVYQKAGIYFSLQSKIKYRGNVSCSATDLRPINTRLSVNVRYSYERRRRFKKNEKKSGTKNDSSFSNELNIKTYSGTRSLKKYRLNTTFTYERKDDCVASCPASSRIITIVMPQINK